MATGTRSERDDQAALVEIAMLIAREAPSATVFEAVCEAAARRLAGDSAAVLRYVGEERGVVLGVWREGGRGLPVNAELDFDRRNSAAGRVRSTGRPARVDSYQGQPGELPLLMRAIDVRATVAAPIAVAGDVWGALAATSSREDGLPAGSEHRISDLAELAAGAVAHEQALQRLEASRRRLVEEADAARRRLERELHQGTQQHLLALTLKLRLARLRAGEDSEIAALIDDALAEAMVANEALRELARGLYPIVLTERGLAAAIQGVAARAPVAVHLRELPRRRFPPLAEATAYFVVAGALLTAPKGLEAIAVAVADRGEVLLVEVSHDRMADAEPRLRGIADRVAAVGGRVQLDGNSVLRAEVPVATFADGL
jgi:signal transduction histidine kinase